MTNFDAQGAHRIVDDFRFVSTEENQIPILRTGTLDHLSHRSIVEVFDDRRLQTIAAPSNVVDLNPRQSFCTVYRHELGVTVDLATRNRCAPRDSQRDDSAAFGGRRLREDFELNILHHVSQLCELEFDPQIGLV